MSTVLLVMLAAAPSGLVGQWQLEGQPFLSLEANGSGLMEGDRLRWKVDGATLVLTDADGEVDRVPFTLEGNTLTLTVGGVALRLTRGGKPSRLQRAAERAGGDEPAPRQAGTDQLSRLLLSSNWCWLRYSNGNSYTQKIHFSADGTWQDFSESDLYVNNQYSQTTTQSVGNRSSGGQWAVRGGQLWLSSPDSPQLQPVPLTITRNSNGYPLINANGREYSMCN